MTNRSLAIAGLLAVLVPLAPAAASASQSYVGVGDSYVTCPFNPSYPCVGGAKFDLRDPDRAEIEIDDEVNDPVGGTYSFVDAQGEDLAFGAFCGQTTVDVPSNAVRLWVHVDGIWGPFDCANPDAFGTTGEVVATFS